MEMRREENDERDKMNKWEIEIRNRKDHEKDLAELILKVVGFTDRRACFYHYGHQHMLYLDYYSNLSNTFGNTETI
uniref:XRN2-binding (XTBD) domain-containing protein n=1 Tax=Caenorhabditis tropicalis TaxID=1561998 RepID=A0A1I7UW89_9PELO